MSCYDQQEADRLRAFMHALANHGWTTWSNTACGRGGVGGQAMTTTVHGDIVQHLVIAALYGQTLEQTADDWAAMFPATRRLDDEPGRPQRAGPDGRPL